MFRLNNFPKLKMIYFALVAPYLNHGILAWGSASNSHLDRLFKLQKRAIRLINHSSFYAHTEPIFKDLKILKFMIFINMRVHYLCIHAISVFYHSLFLGILN